MMILDWRRMARGDDGVELLDELIVRVELLVAVSALGDEDVDILDRRRVGQESHVPTAEVAGEDEPSGLAVLDVIELGDRRAEDVAGVLVGQGDAVQDLGRLVVGEPLELLHDELDVGEFEEGLDGLAGGGLEGVIAEVLGAGSSRCRGASTLVMSAVAFVTKIGPR